MLKNKLNRALVRKSMLWKFCTNHTHVSKSDVVWTDTGSRGDHQLCERHSLYDDKIILLSSACFALS